MFIARRDVTGIVNLLFVGAASLVIPVSTLAWNFFHSLWSYLILYYHLGFLLHCVMISLAEWHTKIIHTEGLA